MLMMADMHVIKSWFDKGSGDGGIPKRCPIASSLFPSSPPQPPSQPPQDDIRRSHQCSGCCPKCGAWVGAGCKKIFAAPLSTFSRPFSTSGKGVGLPFLCPMDESERWRGGLLGHSCVDRSRRLFMANFLVMLAVVFI